MKVRNFIGKYEEFAETQFEDTPYAVYPPDLGPLQITNYTESRFNSFDHLWFRRERTFDAPWKDVISALKRVNPSNRNCHIEIYISPALSSKNFQGPFTSQDLNICKELYKVIGEKFMTKDPTRKGLVEKVLSLDPKKVPFKFIYNENDYGLDTLVFEMDPPEDENLKDLFKMMDNPPKIIDARETILFFNDLPELDDVIVKDVVEHKKHLIDDTKIGNIEKQFSLRLDKGRSSYRLLDTNVKEKDWLIKEFLPDGRISLEIHTIKIQDKQWDEMVKSKEVEKTVEKYIVSDLNKGFVLKDGYVFYRFLDLEKILTKKFPRVDPEYCSAEMIFDPSRWDSVRTLSVSLDTPKGLFIKEGRDTVNDVSFREIIDLNNDTITIEVNDKNPESLRFWKQMSCNEYLSFKSKTSTRGTFIKLPEGNESVFFRPYNEKIFHDLLQASLIKLISILGIQYDKSLDIKNYLWGGFAGLQRYPKFVNTSYRSQVQSYLYEMSQIVESSRTINDPYSPLKGLSSQSRKLLMDLGYKIYCIIKKDNIYDLDFSDLEYFCLDNKYIWNLTEPTQIVESLRWLSTISKSSKIWKSMNNYLNSLEYFDDKVMCRVFYPHFNFPRKYLIEEVQNVENLILSGNEKSFNSSKLIESLDALFYKLNPKPNTVVKWTKKDYQNWEDEEDFIEYYEDSYNESTDEYEDYYLLGDGDEENLDKDELKIVRGRSLEKAVHQWKNSSPLKNCLYIIDQDSCTLVNATKEKVLEECDRLLTKLKSEE